MSSPAAPSPRAVDSPPARRAHRFLTACSSGARWCSDASLWLLRLAFGLVLVVYLVFGGAFLALRYLVLPNIDDYRVQIERQASQMIGVPVSIGDVDASWYGLHPQLTLKDLRFLTRDGATALHVPLASAIVSWWSLPLLGAHLNSLRIEAPELEVRRTAQGTLVVAGIVIDPKVSSDSRLSEWALDQREIAIVKARVHFVDETMDGGALDLDNLDFVIRNQGLHHLFALHAQPPSTLASAVDVRGDFRHAPLARHSADWRAWRGELYANLDYADMAEIARRIRLPLELRRGEGAVRAWLSLDQGVLDRITADVALRDVELQTAADVPALALDHVRGRVVAREIQGKDAVGPTHGHEITLDDVGFRTTQGFELASTDMSERLLFHADGTVASGGFTAGALDLHALAQLSAYLPLSAEHRALLARMEPAGTVSALRYDWTGTIEQPTRYDMNARFAGLSLHEQASTRAPDPEHPRRLNPGVPGFQNLSGQVQMNERGGRMQVDASAAHVVFPGIFAEPVVALDRLVAQADWEHVARGVAVRISNASFHNADATGTLSGTYTSGGKGPGIVNLEGHLSHAEATAVYRYLPLTVPEPTRNWVEHAVLAGGSSDVNFKLRGDLWDFPYVRPADGEFRIAAKVRGGRLDVAPDLKAAGNQSLWPTIDDIAGDLVFERNGFSVAAATARVRGTPVSRVNARMADFSEPRHLLEISGQANGQLAGMIDFVNASPVGGWLGGFLAQTRATGDARLALQLNLPIADMGASRVRGELTLADNEIALEPDLPPFGRTNGRIDFNESGAGMRNVTTSFLGGPLRLDGPLRADRSTVLRGEGTATTAALRRFADLPGFAHLSGAARYTTQIAVRSGATDVSIDSDLVGVGIDLPAPLAKAPNESLGLHIAQSLGDAGKSLRRESIRVALGPAIVASLERERRGSATRIMRAAVGVNERPALPAEGYNVAVNMKALDLDAWRHALGSEGTPGRADTRSRGIELAAQATIDLKADDLTLLGKRFDGVVANVARRDGAWNVTANARQVQGTLTWSDSAPNVPHGRVTARLSRLNVEQAQSSQVVQMLDAAQAEDVPALDVVVDDFEMSGKQFGRLELVADNVGTDAQRRWQLEKLVMVQPDATLRGTGSWARDTSLAPAIGTRPGNAPPRRMQMQFTLDVSNVGKFLDHIGVKDTMRAGTAKLEGEVGWFGSPLSIDYPSLSGHLTLQADKGQFLKTEPGVGRLIGVLSLQSLPRRMALDFRDVFSEGFAFDTVRSNITLANGVASTSDFRMRGVAATVVLEGSADVARETQDLRIVVLPDVNAAGASVVYGLVANPVIGLGTFLAQLFLREPLMKALSHEYRITGSWVDPHVEKIELRKPNPSPPTPAG